MKGVLSGIRVLDLSQFLPDRGVPSSSLISAPTSSKSSARAVATIPARGGPRSRLAPTGRRAVSLLISLQRIAASAR